VVLLASVGDKESLLHLQAGHEARRSHPHHNSVSRVGEQGDRTVLLDSNARRLSRRGEQAGHSAPQTFFHNQLSALADAPWQEQAGLGSDLRSHERSAEHPSVLQVVQVVDLWLVKTGTNHHSETPWRGTMERDSTRFSNDVEVGSGKMWWASS
jgi:hypothetical protein